MSRNKTIIRQTPPSLVGQPQVDFRKEDFDAVVEQKGYRIIHEKSFDCPCKDNQNGNQPLSSCKNCGGSGWVFVNATQTRMILTAMNVNTKYKEWSQEKVGTVAISARNVDRISFMDKLTLIDATSEFTEVIHPIIIEVNTIDKLVGFTFYDIQDIVGVFLFDSNDSKLKLLQNITDYTYQYNHIVLHSKYNDLSNPTLSVRYKHNPQFLVIDIARDIMNSPIVDKATGIEQYINFPIHAIGNRAHYVLDKENYAGDRVFDNSFHSSACVPGELTKFDKFVKNSDIDVIWNTLTQVQKDELFKLLIVDAQYSAITAQNQIYT